MKGARPLTSAEVSRALSVCLDSRERVLVALLAYSGPRISEALALTWSDLFEAHLVKHEVTYRKSATKAQREGRRVPIPQHLREEINRHRTIDGELHWPHQHVILGHHKGRPWSRSAASRALEQVMVRADIKGACTSHSFRKFYATELRNRGVDISYISELLGHADLRTTKAYLSDPTEEQLRAAVNLLPPPTLIPAAR